MVDVLAQVKNHDPDALHFYKEEYDLVHYISMLKTPYVAVMNGHSRKYEYVNTCVRPYFADSYL